MKNNLYIGFNSIVANHNWSLSILYKGEIFAIEIERINRLKDFPNTEFAKILPNLQREMFNQIDDETEDKEKIVAFRNYIDDIINDIISKLDFDLVAIDKIYTINFPFDVSVRGYENKVESHKHNFHHFFHACSTFFPSDFEEAAILCMDHDGYDEELGGINPMHSIWYAKGNNIKFLYSDNFSPEKAQAGIGAVYENHSKICGIGEGTFMGLSGYGKEAFKDIKIFDYSSGGVLLSKQILSKEGYANISEFRQAIINGFKNVYGIEGETDESLSYSGIEKSIYADIADKVQADIEEAILFLANKAYELTGSKNICIAGGVGLNILANNRVLRETKFEKMFVQPACRDSGLSLGALYYLYNITLGNTERYRLVSPGLGFEYNSNEISDSLKKYSDKIAVKSLGNEKYKEVAKLLSEDKIIGFFQGKSEFGPRALGFRSILASPLSKGMKKRVNDIKNRELYRPLAPIMMEDHFKEYLESDYPSPYMTLVADVIDEKKDKIPSVVHIDGTSRYQTVNNDQNKYVYNLLKEFYNITKESVLINTSFNQHHEPIVETPEDAIKMFLSSDIDYLFIGDFLVSKNSKHLNYKFNVENSEREFEKNLDKSKNNNIRGESLLKLLGVYKVQFNYNYEKGDAGIKLIHNNDLKIIIEIKREDRQYSKEVGNIGMHVFNNRPEYKKLLQVMFLYLNKNNGLIYDLIKGI